ncbi:FAD-dependent oxidoreductase [Chloroflexota bacterium]
MTSSENINEAIIPIGEKVGAVMVVGAGVSGIQAALDLVNSSFKVYLVDKEPTIGGKMSQLDKTFPTNDCSMCILSPKFIECARNSNISIFTGSQVDKVDGEAGNFTVTLRQKPRYVDTTLCTNCGTCTEYCPIIIPDAYNKNLATQKCIHVPFPQAVPAAVTVEADNCLFLRRKECQICVPTCKSKAIDFHQQEKKMDIQVGSIILAPGYETFEPQIQSQYGYKKLANVITSLEYERILGASGPFGGQLLRPSDRKTPAKVAWIQCVGSRDTTCNNTYCSAVCCMYAIKQVILSKEHHNEMIATVFHNDIRAYGKGFERYYERAKDMPGIQFIWSKVSILRETPDTKNVVIRYRDDGTGTRDEEFDLVVLSVGLTATESTRQLASRLGIEINSHGFCENTPFAPIETSKPGIYSCGVFHAPMDIPDSVTMASGAASLASQLLSEERGTMIEEREYPEERNIMGEPPRIGVFVCHCGTNIAKIVDVKKVVESAKKLPGVVHAEDSTFSCSIDSVSQMVNIIKEKGLNRVVVSACTPRTHEIVFQDALKEAGLNPYLFEMANIREQCSLVHMKDKENATSKAQDLVKMAVAKAKLLQPLYQLPYTISHSALVIGGGMSGMVSAISLANQGIEVHLIEKNKELGGIARKLYHVLGGGNVQEYLGQLIKQVSENPLITIYLESVIDDFKGYVGNFTSTVKTGDETKEIAHGITIVAAGAEEYTPTEYLYGTDPRVMTLLELDAALAGDVDRYKGVNSLAMIQCVGCRNEERRYCSRVCCSHAIKDAIHLKEINPEIEIYIIYRDMRSYGLREDYYNEAAKKGVKFIRYDVDDKPEVQTATDENGLDVIRVTVTDLQLGQRLMLDVDMLALSAAVVPGADNKPLSQMLKVPLNEDGFFMEAHLKLRPVDFATDGIFMCGLAHSPKPTDESIAQAHAAAARAAIILAKAEMKAGGPISVVNKRKCTGCGLCVQVCPFDAISLDSKEMIAVVNDALCKGCGVCASSCRSGAVTIGGINDEQVLSVVRAL